jgi:Holliday junction DNA helicase RuvA
MICFLKGNFISCHQNAQNRYFLILEVNEVGYEMQIGPNWAAHLQSQPPANLQVFTYLYLREEVAHLFGFSTLAERQLFVQLLGVSGIGAQLALALLDTLGLAGLIEAVVTGNLRRLCQTPGVGKKGAERLVLELKDKLARDPTARALSPSGAVTSLTSSGVEELELTLTALGYSETEINQTLAWLSQKGELQQCQDVEVWIREAIGWLSQH